MRSLALFLLLGSLLALWVGCGGGAEEAVPEPEPEPARDLVLVTIDTWRGDHFDGERAGQPLTPELSAFADGGVRFTAAHSVASETSPGRTSSPARRPRYARRCRAGASARVDPWRRSRARVRP
jgi:hypothetical protein